MGMVCCIVFDSVNMDCDIIAWVDIFGEWLLSVDSNVMQGRELQGMFRICRYFDKGWYCISIDMGEQIHWWKATSAWDHVANLNIRNDFASCCGKDQSVAWKALGLATSFLNSLSGLDFACASLRIRSLRVNVRNFFTHRIHTCNAVEGTCLQDTIKPRS